MDIIGSQRIRELTGYAFAEVDKLVDELRSKGIHPIDFGVGDPTVPTPERIRQSVKVAVDVHRSAGYPSYIGSARFRRSIAEWTERRFGVKLDLEREISSTVGSKEAVFNVHEAILDPGDVALCPSPGYPPYKRGTRFAEGVPYFYGMEAKNGYLPDLGAIPGSVLKRTRLIWINYPNSPSGRLAPPEFFTDVVNFAKRHEIIIFSDEAYSEIYFKAPAHSILEYGREGILVFNSFSKRSAMTGYRIGWVAGDERLVSLFKKLKTNIDSGVPNFVQDAAIAALSDETHVEEMRKEYREKRDIIIDAMKRIGCEDCTPEATLYIWQRVPEGYDSVVFARKLLEPECAVVTTPGEWISDPLADGTNPGKYYVRFALVPGIDEAKLAAERIVRHFGK